MARAPRRGRPGGRGRARRKVWRRLQPKAELTGHKVTGLPPPGARPPVRAAGLTPFRLGSGRGVSSGVSRALCVARLWKPELVAFGMLRVALESGLQCAARR